MKSAGAPSSNELHWDAWKIGHWDGSPCDGHQGDMPCSCAGKMTTTPSYLCNTSKTSLYWNAPLTSAGICCWDPWISHWVMRYPHRSGGRRNFVIGTGAVISEACEKWTGKQCIGWPRSTSHRLFMLCCVLLWFHLSLTHCGLVTPYGDRDLGQHWLR